MRSQKTECSLPAARRPAGTAPMIPTSTVCNTDGEIHRNTLHRPASAILCPRNRVLETVWKTCGARDSTNRRPPRTTEERALSTAAQDTPVPFPDRRAYLLLPVSGCRDPKGTSQACGSHSPVAGHLPLKNCAPFSRLFCRQFGFFLFKDIDFMPEGL
jgi:hypothetical protein